MLGSGIFVWLSKKSDDFISFENISRLNVVYKVEKGVKNKDITENFEEIEKMFNALKIEGDFTEPIFGWDMCIEGYNKNDELEFTISISGNKIWTNEKGYICNQKEIDQVKNYFKK